MYDHAQKLSSQVIGIIGAMQIEIDLLVKEMDVKQEYYFAGFSFYSGHIRGREVVVTRCGVGKTNAACCTQILVDKFSVTAIIHTGIAGSLHREVGVCDVVISSDVTHHDVDPMQLRNLFPFQETFSANTKLIDLATASCQAVTLKAKYHVGRIASGECFVSDTEARERIISLYSPYCVEMEGAAIGHVAYINQIPFVVIRSISDNADEHANETYQSFEQIAAQQSAAIVTAMIARFESC